MEDIEEEVIACGKKIDELYKEDGEGKDEKPMIQIPRISSLTPEICEIAERSARGLAGSYCSLRQDKSENGHTRNEATE